MKPIKVTITWPGEAPQTFKPDAQGVWQEDSPFLRIGERAAEVPYKTSADLSRTGSVKYSIPHPEDEALRQLEALKDVRVDVAFSDGGAPVTGPVIHGYRWIGEETVEVRYTEVAAALFHVVWADAWDRNRRIARGEPLHRQ